MSNESVDVGLIDSALPGRGASVLLNGGFALRRMEDGEIPGLAAAMAGMEPWAGLGYGVETLARYWSRADPGAERLGVYEGDVLCGALCMRPRWLRGAFLELLCVLPAAQGRGVGRAALEWLAREAAALGPNLWTSTGTENRRALDFYLAAGFFEAAVLPDLLAPGRDEILLRRALGAARPTRGAADA